MSALVRIPLFDRLEGARSILIAGAGGGFDVYAGLPLALALAAEGRSVHLANYTFSELGDPRFWAAPGVAAVLPDSDGSNDYFPERTLARWLSGQGMPQPVYAFAPSGVAPLRAAYETLVGRLDLDAIILIDGGTDILLRGDESRLGTPEEDMTSLAALHHLDNVPTRLVACLGFGIDAHHGVNHTQVLENIADLTRSGAYLGAFSIPADSPEAAAYLDAVQHANTQTPLRPSIVNGQIAASLRGEHGNAQFSDRTARTELFVNPLMGIYFTFDLDGLAAHNAYLDTLSDTQTRDQVALAIEAYRYDTNARAPRQFPH